MKLNLSLHLQTVANRKVINKDPLSSAKGIFCFKSLAVICLLISCFTLHAQPRIQVTESKKNFGSVKRGEVIKNEFEITNIGNQPLIITDVEISCSCTSVDFPKEPILPNEKKKVLVNFNTATVYGRQDRVVLLNTNDPSGSVKLRYKGIVSKK